MQQYYSDEDVLSKGVQFIHLILSSKWPLLMYIDLWSACGWLLIWGLQQDGLLTEYMYVPAAKCSCRLLKFHSSIAPSIPSTKLQITTCHTWSTQRGYYLRLMTHIEHICVHLSALHFIITCNDLRWNFIQVIPKVGPVK